MSQLNEVVLITKEDYTTLYTTGTVTTHGVTIPYDANSLYFSDDVSSEMIDDTNSTKKFVTTTEKNTWNEKQNAITKQHDQVNYTGYTTETKIATINATTFPTINAVMLSVIICTPPGSNTACKSLYPEAASIVGTAKKKENSAAVSLESF